MKKCTTTSFRRFLFGGGMFVLGFSLATIISTRRNFVPDGTNALDHLLNNKEDLSSILDFETSPPPLSSVSIPSNNQALLEKAAGNTLVNFLNEEARKIMYLHVGKTGGTSLEKVLRVSCSWGRHSQSKIDECLRTGPLLNNEEGMLSNLTAYIVHEDIRPNLVRGKISKNNVTSFLFTLRNPIARAVSAFDMRHPANQKRISKHAVIRAVLKEFYIDCFPTMQDLVDILSKKKKVEYTNGDNKTVDCIELGSHTIAGHGNFLANDHLRANYEDYAKVTTKAFPDKEIFVIRTEKLWHDVEILEYALGGRERAFQHLQNHSFTHGSERYHYKSSLTKEGKVTICCFLSEENIIYEDLMRRAVNLEEDEKIGSLLKLYNDCGIGVNATAAWTNQSFPWMKWKENGCT